MGHEPSCTWRQTARARGHAAPETWTGLSLIRHSQRLPAGNGGRAKGIRWNTVVASRIDCCWSHFSIPLFPPKKNRPHRRTPLPSSCMEREKEGEKKAMTAAGNSTNSQESNFCGYLIGHKKGGRATMLFYGHWAHLLRRGSMRALKAPNTFGDFECTFNVFCKPQTGDD